MKLYKLKAYNLRISGKGKQTDVFDICCNNFKLINIYFPLLDKDAYHNDNDFFVYFRDVRECDWFLNINLKSAFNFENIKLAFIKYEIINMDENEQHL